MLPAAHHILSTLALVFGLLFALEWARGGRRAGRLKAWGLVALAFALVSLLASLRG